jgi:hypothetical protein
MKKRILSILLTLCMLFCLVPISVFAEEVRAWGSAAIQLGADTLNKTVNTEIAPTVYFGQDHENNPAAWRVIGYDGNGVTSAQGDMTLLAASNMSSGLQFADFGASNEYAPSNLKTAIDALAEKLTTEENTAVKKRTLTSGNYNEENTDCVAGAQVDNTVFWPLSSKEAIAVNHDLRIADPEHPSWASSCWWLRSPGYSNHDAATVRGDGSVVYYGNAINNWWCVRPAFKLNLNSVLFASAAVGGKPDGGLTEVSKYSGNEWKLTLLDSSRNFAVTEKAVSGDPGDTVTLHYTGATGGLNEYISAIIADSSGARYYGRVAQPTAESGTVEIKIPSGLAPGSYTLKVSSEQYNGDYNTDYASNFTDIALTVENQPDEQFSLTPGGRYYFDLSAMNIPGTANSNLPDKTLHYVPFTYVGTVDAYSMENETDTAKQPYEHSLFISDYTVKNNLHWDALNEKGLIFGLTYTSDGVNYTLRAPSVGDHHRDEGEGSGLAPIDNEWDTIYQKSPAYIKNYYSTYSVGQDKGTVQGFIGTVVSRGRYSAIHYTFVFYPISGTPMPDPDFGFRPVLEVLNPGTLGPDGMKVVTLDLDGGKLGNSSEDIQIIVKNGSEFTAPASDGLTRPDGNTGRYFMWLGSDGNLYAPGGSVPALVTTLTAQWKDTEKPTGEIIIGTNKWQEFLNKLTFGLFFKDTQTVTINAADNSGTVFVSYLVTDRDLSEEELKSLVFSGYEEPFHIDPNGEYIVYAMLVDESLNITYLRSDRVTLDNVRPVIGGIEDGKTYCEAQTVTIDEKYVGTVTVNGTEVRLDETGSFTLSPADGEQKIVVTDKAGNIAEMTVTVNDGHTGGKATCTERAVCEVCGKAYGEPDPKNHTDLKHIPAKAATEDAEGNIEYWYCEGCNKYYSDKDGTKEIKKADTVTAKLPKTPPTGDTSSLSLWLILLLASGGAATGAAALSRKKKHDR